MRGVAAQPESVDDGEIVGGAVAMKFDQRGKVSLVRSQREAAAQRGGRLPGAGALDQMKKRAAQPFGRRGFNARELLLVHRIELAPPSVTVAGPLRMQCLRRDMAAQQAHPLFDETPAISVEQFAGGRAMQTGLHRPNMQVDDGAGACVGKQTPRANERSHILPHSVLIRSDDIAPQRGAAQSTNWPPTNDLL